MIKKIKNPYAAHYSKSFKTAGGGWCVSKRWVFNDKVRFDWMCNTSSEGAARLIAKALNALEKKDEPNEIVVDSSNASKPDVPVVRKPTRQGGFDFLQE